MIRFKNICVTVEVTLMALYTLSPIASVPIHKPSSSLPVPSPQDIWKGHLPSFSWLRCGYFVGQGQMVINHCQQLECSSKSDNDDQCTKHSSNEPIRNFNSLFLFVACLPPLIIGCSYGCYWQIPKMED
ncbi:hypothetical protein L218DRAFT_959894 [Marasmius fiardii PR-910]|nr:hypothetical protein L218DRAFT_959894 [Marasmius fiardii PR-910]